MLDELVHSFVPDLIRLCIPAHTIERVQQDSRVTHDRLGRRLPAARPDFVMHGDALSLEGVPVPEATPEPALPSTHIPTRARLDSSLRVHLPDLAVRAVGPVATQALDVDVSGHSRDERRSAWGSSRSTRNIPRTSRRAGPSCHTFCCASKRARAARLVGAEPRPRSRSPIRSRGANAGRKPTGDSDLRAPWPA